MVASNDPLAPGSGRRGTWLTQRGHDGRTVVWPGLRVPLFLARDMFLRYCEGTCPSFPGQCGKGQLTESMGDEHQNGAHVPADRHRTNMSPDSASRPWTRNMQSMTCAGKRLIGPETPRPIDDAARSFWKAYLPCCRKFDIAGDRKLSLCLCTAITLFDRKSYVC